MAHNYDRRIAADKNLDKIKKAVEAATSFMDVGSELKKAGIKYDFSTEMLPLYRITLGGQTYGIVNKKYAETPDVVVGDIAIGKM